MALMKVSTNRKIMLPKMFILTIFLFVFCVEGKEFPEARVIRDIFAGYNRNARPVQNPNTTVELNIYFILVNIENLDEKLQTLSTYGTLALMWKDEHLQWDPNEYNGTHKLVLDSSLLWLPEIILFKNAETASDLGLDRNFRVWVDFQGTVFWCIHRRFETPCNVNLLKFPFDTQTCTIEFMSVLHGKLGGGPMVSFVASNDTASNLHLYFPKSGWELLNLKVTDSSLDGPLPGTFYPIVSVSLTIKRDAAYHVTNILVPSMFLSFLSMFVFLLPHDSGEKISLQVTVVLSYLMLLLVVADNTPSTGGQIPLIAHNLLASQCVAMASLLVTIFIMNIYHGTWNHPMPPSLRRIIIIMSILVCKPSVEKGKTRENSVSTTGKLIPRDKTSTVREDAKEMIGNIKTLEAKNSDNNYQNEWRDAAFILDRFFFYLFFAVVTVSNLSMLSIIIQ